MGFGATTPPTVEIPPLIFEKQFTQNFEGALDWNLKCVVSFDYDGNLWFWTGDVMTGIFRLYKLNWNTGITTLKVTWDPPNGTSIKGLIITSSGNIYSLNSNPWGLYPCGTILSPSAPDLDNPYWTPSVPYHAYCSVAKDENDNVYIAVMRTISVDGGITAYYILKRTGLATFQLVCQNPTYIPLGQGSWFKKGGYFYMIASRYGYDLCLARNKGDGSTIKMDMLVDLGECFGSWLGYDALLYNYADSKIYMLTTDAYVDLDDTQHNVFIAYSINIPTYLSITV